MAFYQTTIGEKSQSVYCHFLVACNSDNFIFLFFHSYLPLSTPAMVWTPCSGELLLLFFALLPMYALSHVDTNVLFPITTTASLIITVLVGIIFLLVSTLPSFKLLVSFLQSLRYFYLSTRAVNCRYSRPLIGVGSGIILYPPLIKSSSKSCCW